MKEESGNFLYIVFILLGVALISVGAFYLLTDETVELDGQTNVEEKKDDNKKDEIKEVSYSLKNLKLSLDHERTIRLNNKNISFLLKEENDNLNLLLNDKVIVTESIVGSITAFALDNYLLVSSTSGSETTVRIFLFDSDGNKIKEYHNVANEVGMVYYDEFSDYEIEIYGTRLEQGNIINLSDGNTKVDVCDIDKLKELNVSNDLLVSAKFELKYYSNNTFEMKKIDGQDEKLIEYQQKVCNGDS